MTDRSRSRVDEIMDAVPVYLQPKESTRYRATVVRVVGEMEQELVDCREDADSSDMLADNNALLRDRIATLEREKREITAAYAAAARELDALREGEWK